ncbi:hypothetical protein GOFOIKOB_0347 [Methylobacterium tardum]|jgi:hypothetical protein|uniref:DUF6894 domain-containing protein n=1 Tax=Methylobacterium tardum TaxID=374432 RepID=A0AA37TCP4_9HYPH|nr:hypothetical protein [Methylobacterium tardum]URD36887.1 hypothetical protein M6G65_32090 [Methylobacterium tardum]GJE47326.1 hypothetical protein GOFOIKOB_0347 [Methylobacterium tardum]GLS71301.1 hypothetical protein GCM10007890_33140 [Methylobacterium tardum]
MPLYYFDTDVGGDRLHDEEGLDLPDAAAARDAAMGALPDMARDELGSGDRHTLTVRVRDASGTVVYSATLDLTGEWHVPQTVT